MQKFIKDYSLISILMTGMILALAGQFYFGWIGHVDEQESHQQIATMSTYMPVYLDKVFENWQSEMLQLALAVALTMKFAAKNSEGDRIETKIDSILKKLNEKS